MWDKEFRQFLTMYNLDIQQFDGVLDFPLYEKEFCTHLEKTEIPDLDAFQKAKNAAIGMMGLVIDDTKEEQIEGMKDLL